jgi:hypothetical protein
VSEGDDPVDAELNRQLNDFAHSVILPVLELVEQYCDRQGDSVRLAIGHPTGDVVLDHLLTELPRSTTTRWLVATLTLHSKARPGFMAQFSDPNGEKDKFYLTAEVEVCADGVIRAVPSVFCSNRGSARFRRLTRAVEGGNDEPITTQAHLLRYFVDCLETFEMVLSASL